MSEQRTCVSPVTNAAFTSRLNAECRSPVSSEKISSTTIVVATKSETSSGLERGVEKPSKTNKGRRKTGRAYRRKMRRKTIQKYRNGNDWIYGPHLCGHWEGNQFVFGSYVKHPQNASNKAFFKRVSNKKVRRNSGIPTKGNGYRKVFDYWWTID